MSNTRRGFLALFCGGLVSGAIATRASAAQPTLILPAAFVPSARAPEVGLIDPAAPTGRPLLDGLVGQGKSQMHALLECKRLMPDAAFLDWLEGGLRQARFYNGRDEATMERLVAQALSQHGSMSAAKRAGAL